MEKNTCSNIMYSSAGEGNSGIKVAHEPRGCEVNISFVCSRVRSCLDGYGGEASPCSGNDI